MGLIAKVSGGRILFLSLREKVSEQESSLVKTSVVPLSRKKSASTLIRGKSPCL